MALVAEAYERAYASRKNLLKLGGCPSDAHRECALWSGYFGPLLSELVTGSAAIHERAGGYSVVAPSGIIVHPFIAV